MLTIPKTGSLIESAVVTALNALRRDTVVLGTRAHADIVQSTSLADPDLPTLTSDTITAPAAADLAKTITLANQALGVMKRHVAEHTLVHKAADPTAVAALDALDEATDLATAITLLNGLKAAQVAHCAQAGVHFTDDSTNTVSADDATDLASAKTLADNVKAKVNAHVASAPAGAGVKLIPV